VLTRLGELGITTPNESGFPIIEIPLANADDVDEVGDVLFDNGIYATIAVYPLVPRDQVGSASSSPPPTPTSRSTTSARFWAS
jgi:hypothetical protein